MLLIPFKISLLNYSLPNFRPKKLSSGITVSAKTGNKMIKKYEEDGYSSTLKALNSKSRFPRKSLGQHYMLNSSINEQLASMADVKEGDVVLEIGPGTGSLTNVLVDAGATVLAIEKDPHMAALVTERFASGGRTKILEEDFTKCDIRSHLLPLLRNIGSSDGQPRHAKVRSVSLLRNLYNAVAVKFLVLPLMSRSLANMLGREQKVVANIPFNITTDIVKLLLPMGDIISEVVLLVQDETALRLVDASSRTSEYRPINIFVNFYSDAEYNFHVPRSNFFPQPNVDAAVVTFKIKQAVDYPPVSSIKSFFSMVNSAFNGKRKMLRRSLQHICTSIEIETALQEAGLAPTSRPEELTLDDFVKLHSLIVKA